MPDQPAAPRPEPPTVSERAASLADAVDSGALTVEDLCRALAQEEARTGLFRQRERDYDSVEDGASCPPDCQWCAAERPTPHPSDPKDPRP